MEHLLHHAKENLRKKLNAFFIRKYVKKELIGAMLIHGNVDVGPARTCMVHHLVPWGRIHVNFIFFFAFFFWRKLSASNIIRP